MKKAVACLAFLPAVYSQDSSSVNVSISYSKLLRIVKLMWSRL